jgi:metal-responsive CopG/Arc/MetJ family transcriptional regulator
VETIRVSVALEAGLLDRADKVAAQDGQTRSEFLRQAVTRYVDERETWLKLEKEAERLPELLAELEADLSSPK